MFSDQLNLLEGSGCHVEARETFTSFDIRVKSTNVEWEIVSAINNSLSEISVRDNFEFSINLDGSISSIISTTQRDDISALESFFDENQEDAEELSLKIEINKGVDNNTTSIYGIAHLKSYVEDTSLRNVLLSFNRLFSERHMFEVFESMDEFGSHSIRFYSHYHPEVTAQLEQLDDRQTIIDFIRENSSEVVSKGGLLARDFCLTQGSNHPYLDRFFSAAHTVLSLASISNIFEITEDDSVNLKINGYKSIQVDGQNIDDFNYDQKCLAELNKWLFEGGGRSDKLGLVRNILSLNLDEKGRIKIDQEVIRSIRSNYSIYLKENIQQYIEIKNKVTDYIFDHSAKINQSLDEYLSNFRGNLVAMLGFILSVVLVNGLKDNGTSLIFSAEYLFVVFVICVLSLGWMIFSYRNLSNRAKKYKEDLRSVLHRNYYQVIVPEELEAYINPVMDGSHDDFKDQLRTYTKWWVGILGIILIAFVVGYFSFSEHDTVNSDITDQLKQKKAIVKEPKTK